MTNAAEHTKTSSFLTYVIAIASLLAVWFSLANRRFKLAALPKPLCRLVFVRRA